MERRERREERRHRVTCRKERRKEDCFARRCLSVLTLDDFRSRRKEGRKKERLRTFRRNPSLREISSRFVVERRTESTSCLGDRYRSSKAFFGRRAKRFFLERISKPCDSSEVHEDNESHQRLYEEELPFYMENGRLSQRIGMSFIRCQGRKSDGFVQQSSWTPPLRPESVQSTRSRR